ncbi:MAG: electron transfer flavoprotein subunit alpha/FixB family protein [Deltaproteobacteria bacterium]|nr:MAG: electron transfer flavoprotein subunit alpha/FixB family protein [Deltaproteobacteria bacterium]RTZ97920.1 MAG: electron transfer flavoprotein subunit alpha/FixB family protein [Deltaproteobacteria bacterium]
MTDQIFAYITHKNGVADDSALELSVAAGKINADAAVTAIVAGAGDSLSAVCDEMAKAYPTVWKLDNDALAYPNAEVIRNVLASILPDNAMVLVPHDTFGMDLSPGLSVKMNAAFISDVVDVEGLSDNTLTIVRQEYGGQVSTHVAADISSGAVINVRPGVFQPDDIAAVSGEVVDKSDDIEITDAKRRFLETVEAEVGDVDITKSDVLVSVGRGIEDEDNLEIAFDLAKAMGADVSCSRPIVDAKWMEKSRQVGTSGQTVKPKVYLAAGISGSFQHLGGLKGNPFIIAINKNTKAPIFQVADVGIEADILDFLPELTEAIEEL